MTNPSTIQPESAEEKETAAPPRRPVPVKRMTSANDKDPGVAPEAMELDEEQFLTLENKELLSENEPVVLRALRWGGAVLTTLWIGAGVVWMIAGDAVPAADPVHIGLALTGILAPVALLWFMLAQVQRGADVRRHAEALRAELQALIFPTDDRAHRVSKDIERLCQQAAELAGASRAVVKAIARARQGMRTEIRDYAAITKKTEFHIDRLAGVLHDRAQKLNDLTGEIEQRTAVIDEKTQAGAEAWDHATLTVLERAGEMEAALGRGTDKVLHAADEVGGKIKASENRISTAIESLQREGTRAATQLDGVGTAFDLRIKTLGGQADRIVTAAGALTGATDRQLSELQSARTAALTAIAEASQLLEQQQAAVGQNTDSLRAESQAAANRLADGIAQMATILASLDQQISQAEARLTKQTSDLKNAAGDIGRETEGVENAVSTATRQLEDAAGQTRTGAQALTEAVETAAASLGNIAAKTREDVQALVQDTEIQVGRLAGAGDDQAGRFGLLLRQLEEQRALLDAAGRQAGRQAEDLGALAETQAQSVTTAAAGLAERAESVRAMLTTPLQDINAAVAAADRSHAQIADTLHRRLGELNDASGKARDTAETIRADLRGQAHEMSALAGQIAGHARGVNEELAKQTGLLGSGVKDTLVQADEVRRALEAQAARLHVVADEASKSIADLEGRIAGRTVELDSAAHASLASLRAVEEALEARGRQVAAQADGASRTFQQAIDALGQASNELHPKIEHILERAQEAHGQLEAVQVNLGQVADSNLEKLHRLGVVFDERLVALRDGSNQAAGLLKDSGDHLQARAQDIERAATSASDRLYDVEHSLQGQATDIHLITDQARLRVDAMQNALNAQFHELSEATGQAMARLGDVGSVLRGNVEQLASVTDDAASRFETAGRNALAQGSQLGAAAEDILRQTLAASEKARREAETMVDAIRMLFGDLDRAGDDVSVRAREIAEQIHAVLATTRLQGDSVRRQADDAAAVTTDSANRVMQAAQALSGQLERIGASADHAAMQIVNSRDGLAAESDRLLNVSQAAMRVTEETAGTLGRQTDALSRAIAEAGTHIEKIRAGEGRVQRDAFLVAAKFIVESLHSLSLDITRSLDGEIGERTWKAYQRGDTSAFTRRLAGTEGNVSPDRVRDKFAGDAEFRNYVQRFLRQYEEIAGQAAASDHGGLLTGVFASSDIGKLYQFLCSVTGHEPQSRRA